MTYHAKLITLVFPPSLERGEKSRFCFFLIFSNVLRPNRHESLCRNCRVHTTLSSSSRQTHGLQILAANQRADSLQETNRRRGWAAMQTTEQTLA